MNKLNLSTQFANKSTEVSNIFIDNYMPLANGEFVKIYLYLLRCVSDNQTTISVSALADFFNQTEADILRALKYWDKVGAVSLDYDDTQKALTGITFCDLSTAQRNADLDNKANTNYTDLSDIRLSSDLTANKVSPAANLSAADGSSFTKDNISKTYTPSQIAEFSARDDFGILLYAVSAYLGSTLNPSDLSSIAYFYDTLHFPADLIDYLVEYCVSKGKKSMRYIEKVALAWADEGISSVSEAKALNAGRSEATYSVLNAFGITNRAAGKTERDYITKWTDVYCFNNDIIIEACNRTLKATHQPSFEYADSILSKWQEANVKTAEDIKKMDEQFELNRQSRFAKRSNNVITKNSNRFNNFHQREIDIDSLESSLISNNG